MKYIVSSLIFVALISFGLIFFEPWVNDPFSVGTEEAEESLVSVILETDLGVIEIALNVDQAPVSSASFLSAVDQGLFVQGGNFYRAVRPDNDKGFGINVIQGGVAWADLEQAIATKLPLVPHESTKQTGLRHQDGTISLARAKNSTGSAAMFFICIGAQPTLDYEGKNRYDDIIGFAAFGQVVRGMDIVRIIHQMETNGFIDYVPMQGQILSKPVNILKAYRKKTG